LTATGRIDTILFDAGGTLVFPDCARVANLFSGHHPETAARLAQSWYRTIYAFDELILVLGPEAQNYPENRMWVWFWNRMAESAGLPAVSDELAEKLAAENRVRPLWDQTNGEAHALLAHLAGRYKLGVVSNSDGSVEATFTRLGLARWFSVIVDSAVVGVSKPDPRIFDFALKPLGASPESTVFIGDSFTLDCRGAQSAGIHAILLDPHGLHMHRGVERIARLSDLREKY
jgi:HAD superfamily hydrolase (TIGR01509 family)